MEDKKRKAIMIRLTTTHRDRAPKPPQGESAIRKNKRSSLKAVIAIIQDRGKTVGMDITVEEIALKAGISKERIDSYLNDEERTPDDLPHILLSAYQQLLDAAQKEDNRESLKRSVVWIRNHGLSKGMDITVEEMALKTGISGEQLYAFLNGELETPDDLERKLESAYKDLLKNVEQVEVIEDINTIIRRPPL